MDFRLLGLDSPIIHALHLLDGDAAAADEKSANVPSRTYVRDAKAMAATPADVKEYPNSYVFIVDMPGLKSGDIKGSVVRSFEETGLWVCCNGDSVINEI
ncbi:hypothetical protein U1Q18_002970 [Sarracenia purpurea var. burkii]